MQLPAPIGLISRSPLVMVVSASSPAKSVPEFIVDQKSIRGADTWARRAQAAPAMSAANSSRCSPASSFVHVPYRGSPPALTDLIGRSPATWMSTTSPLLDRLPRWPVARACREPSDGSPARRAADQRLLAQLRGLCLELRRRAQKLPGDRPEAQRRDRSRRCGIPISRRSWTWATRHRWIRPPSSAG